MVRLARFDRLIRRFVPSVWLDRVSGYDVFVSFAHSDGIDFAQAIASKARSQGLTVFLDKEGIRDGEDISGRIERGLERARLLLVVATPGAVKSKEVHKERELFQKRKTWLYEDRPIAVVYPGNDVSIDLEGIKAIETDGTIEGVAKASLAAVRDQVGWATSLRRLYSVLLAMVTVVVAAIALLTWSLSTSKTETIAQGWEAVGQAAESAERYSEAESAYRSGSDFAARLNVEAERVSDFHQLIPFRRVLKPPQSACRFATLLADGRMLVVYSFTDSSDVSIRIEDQEVVSLDTDSESTVECDWISREDDEWTLAISNGEKLWIIESAGDALPKNELVFTKSHHCFCVSTDGIVKVLTFEDAEATVHRLKFNGAAESISFRPGRNLVGEHQSHVTKTTVLCGAFAAAGLQEAYVVVVASPQSDLDHACQIDVFELGKKEGEFSLLASLPLQSIEASTDRFGDGALAEPYDEPLTAEGRVDFATGLSVLNNHGTVAFQFVQGENFMVGKPFHVVLPAEDFSQDSSRTWKKTHENASQRIYLGAGAVESIFLVNSPFPAGVVHRNGLVRFITLAESPSVVASFTADSENCELACMPGNQSPVLMNSSSKILAAFTGEHRARYAVPDLHDDVVALHAGGSKLIVVESADSLFCFRQSSESDGAGYNIDIDGNVTVPAFQKTETPK
jgi:hypothetical protein